MMASSQRFIGASIEDATGKDAAYCNAYVDNIYQYICHSNATVDSNQMVTSQSIKEVLQFSAKQTDTGSQSLIQFSANLATTGYATLGAANATWQHEAEPPPNKLTVFYIAACALFNLPLSKHNRVSPQEYKITQQHNNNSAHVACGNADKVDASKEQTNSLVAQNQAVSSVSTKRKNTSTSSPTRSKKTKSTSNLLINESDPNYRNPYDGREVCYDVDSELGKKLCNEMNVITLPEEAFVVNSNHRYLFGVVRNKTKTQNVYQVFWNYTRLPSTNVHGTYIIDEFCLQPK